MNNKIKKFQGGNVLPEITVVPNKLFLYTYYPLINSRYPLTGHSELRVSTPDYFRDMGNGYAKRVEGTSAHINKKMKDSGYNLVTNNCADATRCALETILEKEMNPYFFTTPGDVLDFFKENFDVRKVKNDGKRRGQETWYTNITPLLAEVIKNQLYELIQENKKDRLKLLANARKWKHKEGGIIKAADGTKTNFGLKVSNFLGSELGNTLLNAGTSIVSGIILNNAINKLMEANNANMKVDKEKAFFDRYRELKALKRKTGPTVDDNGNIINHSSIVSDNEAWNEALKTTDTSEIEKTYDRVNKELGNQKYMNLLDTILNSIGGISSAILNNIGKKKNTNSTSSTNSTFGNYVSTQFKNYGTFNSDGSMNLGGGLGTFSITGGYKPQQYQFKMETPKLKYPF